MNPANQRTLLLVGFLCVASAAAAGAVSHIVNHGLISVRVHEQDGPNIALCVPTAAVWAALPLVPEHVWQDAGRHSDEWAPLADSILDDLEEFGDFVMVSVESRDETVEIRKTGGRFEIHVESPDTDVHVSVPLRTARMFLNRIEKAQIDA